MRKSQNFYDFCEIKLHIFLEKLTFVDVYYRFLAMIEQNGEKIGSAISKHSDNIMGFGF